MAITTPAHQVCSIKFVNCPPVITVLNGNNSGADSLRQAIADVCVGGTITFDSDYTITLASELAIGQDLTIDGTGHAITVSGNLATRVFNVTAGNVTFANLTIALGNVQTKDCGGSTLYYCGGGLMLQNSSVAVTVTHSAFRFNQANNDYGSGIYNERGTLRVQHSTFYGTVDGGWAFQGAGIYNNYGTVTRSK